MKNEILEILVKHPGIRVRAIARYIGASNLAVSEALYSMLDEGLVTNGLVTKISVCHPELMECYDIWYKV